jgi:hypothetical protein
MLNIFSIPTNINRHFPYDKPNLFLPLKLLDKRLIFSQKSLHHYLKLEICPGLKNYSPTLWRIHWGPSFTSGVVTEKEASKSTSTKEGSGINTASSYNLSQSSSQSRVV